MLHEKHFIHRDIKPDNFTIGLSTNVGVIHMIDFGLSKKYYDDKNQMHIEYTQGKSLTGTARYASVNAHLGIEQSRRDDLESIGYMFIYFAKGSLPWQGIAGKTKAEKYQKIAQSKATISAEILTRGMPNEFMSYFQYCKKLKFEETPDYDYLRKLFSGLFTKSGYVTDGKFDWNLMDMVVC
jgi:serine/threonine protein kinase